MTGWSAPPVALAVGQVSDRVRSLPPGEGRLHAQRFPNGAIRIHVDRYDPARGPVEAVAHVLAETSAGAVLALVALVALGALGTQD